MLPKKLKIKKAFFPAHRMGGIVFHSPHLLLRVFKGKAEKECKSPTRFSFSISKKNLNLATQRNTLRRRGYAIVQKVIQQIKYGFVCLFSFKKGTEKVSFEELQGEIEGLLKKAHVW